MTPSEQILAHKQDLEQQITQLISGFESRTGVVVSGIDLLSFEQGRIRTEALPLNLRVNIVLPLPR